MKTDRSIGVPVSQLLTIHPRREVMPQLPRISEQPAAAAPRLPVRYLVLVWLCLAATLAYGQRFPLGVAAKLVQEDLTISTEAMGFALGAFFFTYAIFQIPGGWLADRWGSRAALAVCVAFCSLATTCTGLATGLTGLILARLAAGVGQAGIFPAATASMACWFPKTERAIASGFLAGFMSLGGVIATAIGGGLLGHGIGWPWVFALFGLPGFVWAALFYLWFRNRPTEHSSVSAAELAVICGPAEGDAAPEVQQPESTPWWALARSRAMWLIAWQQFFRAAGYALFTSWFPNYLSEIYGSSVEAAGVLTSIALVAVVVGSPLGGILSDWMLRRTGSRRGSRQGLAAVTMLLCAAFFLGSAYVANSGQAIVLIAAAAFFGSIAGPVAYAITIDMGGRHVGTVFSIMNMAGNVGAAAFPVAVGRMVKNTGRWDWLPLFVAGIYVAGASCWLLLSPAGTVFDENEES